MSIDERYERQKKLSKFSRSPALIANLNDPSPVWQTRVEATNQSIIYNARRPRSRTHNVKARNHLFLAQSFLRRARLPQETQCSRVCF